MGRELVVKQVPTGTDAAVASCSVFVPLAEGCKQQVALSSQRTHIYPVRELPENQLTCRPQPATPLRPVVPLSLRSRGQILDSL